jgi:hypothetical protein
MSQDHRQQQMSAIPKRDPVPEPPQATPVHARRIDCGGASAAAPGSHPGRTPCARPARSASTGVGRRRPR